MSLTRRTPLTARTPLRAHTGLQASGPWSRTVPLLSAGGTGKSTATGRLINPVSDKRVAENRERRAMADRRWPDRRDGTVLCAVSFCDRPADDLHEILPRGRGGSITDEENTKPVCRQHNEEITRGPDWAYREGLIKHDGLCCQGRKVCSRYAEAGEVA